MSEDRWVEGWSRLTGAIENAYEIGMTEQEIQDCWDECKPPTEPFDYSGHTPKPKKGTQ